MPKIKEDEPMHIDMEIKPVSVEVDGAIYPVAAKTLAVARKLAAIEENNQGEALRYQTWLEHLRVILGGEAVATLFPDGDESNLDRMEAIYAGVMATFDYNGRALREARDVAELERLRELADTLSTITDKVREINDRYPGIARPGAVDA